MFAELTQMLLEAIKTHGILAVIIGVAIETVIIPLPSPIIIMAAGYLLIPQGSLVIAILNSLWIAVVAGLAQTIGSFLLFFPGYYIGKPFIEKYEKYHGVSWNEIQQFQKKFGRGRREDITLFALRAIPVMPLSVISGVAGILKIDPKRYAAATFLGVIPRNMMLALLGYFFGEFYHTIAGKIDNAETVMTLIVAVMIITYIAGHKTGLFHKVRKGILK